MAGILVEGNMTAQKIKTKHIYGVEWTMGPATAAKRILDAAAFADPVPAVGSGKGSSPFDDCYPWNGMEEYNLVNGAVSYKQGAVGFSRTAYDVVVKIPAFWCKLEKVGNIRRFLVADYPAAGFELHMAFQMGGDLVADAIYVGRYHFGANYRSVSGAAPLVNMTRSAARSGARALGARMYLHSMAAREAEILLYLVEYANMDGEAAIAKGYMHGNSAAIPSGGTDSMVYHTGRAAGEDGKTQMQYRHIENFWGNVREWADGINFWGTEINVCNNPAQFADDTRTNYLKVGYALPASGYITDFGVDPAFPGLFLPVAVGGSTTSHCPDYVYSDTTATWYLPYVGGGWSYGADGGPFYADCSYAAGGANTSIGGRLLRYPEGVRGPLPTGVSGS